MRDPKDQGVEKITVRILVPFTFLAAGVLAFEIAYHTDEVPGVAFSNHLVYGGLLFLVIFYGVLLLVLPLARAIFAGELPIELTTKGPRYQDRELASSRKAAEELEADLASMEGRVTEDIKATAGKTSAGINAVRAEAEQKLAALNGEIDRLDERINKASKSNPGSSEPNPD
jgi:hypothetical protein